MNLSTITMDPEQAQERAEPYRRLALPSVEEKAILAGYLALASGKQLINLGDTIRAGGCDDRGWPLLAVLGANRSWCHLRVSKSRDNSGVRWAFAPQQYTDGRHTRDLYVFDGVPIEDYSPTYGSHRAMVPLVPPEHRPRRGNQLLKLDNYVILWEVAEWAPAPQPPGDPALLRHLAGDLYTVEAVWDLTPLEQAVLAGRNQ